MKSFMLIALLVVGLAAVAQKSDYIGQEKRAIKSLSEDDIQSLLEGRGMGLAKAAELNGYPGPLHILQMDRALKLSPGQIAKVQAIYDRMHREATALGKELLTAEAALEKEFRGGKANADRVSDLTAMIGALQSKLRACHLNAHVATKPLLTKEQIRAYNKFRGYGA
jgi:hypothetical protein